ncbi:MAG: endonuclease MutS2, partial [Dehalococcoidia bacterium]
EILAGYTSFSASRQLALSLKPSSDPELVWRQLQQSSEARHLLSLEPHFSIGGVLDVREAVKMAARGKVLEPQTLVDIQSTLAAARRVRTNLGKLAKEFPSLWDIAEQMVELPDLEGEISRCVAPTGELVDSASAELAHLRHRLKETRQQLLDRLEAIMKSPRSRRFVQESFITEREGRYVIPIKAEFRKEMKGIVHDVSNTGATVLVEPWTTVELGNELRQLIVEEKREVERILAALSAEAGAREGAISRDVALVAEVDLALAKARYAQEAKATEPLIASDGGNRGGVLTLFDARHPLLKGKAVPLSVEIGQDFSILIVTGPNTGGKTVALKTIGLLTLMAQAGMPIPASEESSVPIFDGVFADIGDEQSIEQTLSTFSWHMGNIVRVIGNSTEKSLVLLDELGTSTDPNEGAALARAILAHFLSRGTMVVATTHYGDLKAFAHATQGLQNASLDFDPVTLAPTYHLTLGIPGGSNALAMASQLGLPSAIIAAAKGMVAQGTQEIDGLLKYLMSEQQKVKALLDGLKEEKDEAEKARSQLENELERLSEQERHILREARDRLAREMAELQKEIRQASQELRKARSKESIEQARRALAATHQRLGGPDRQTEAVLHGGNGELAGASSIAVGDKVWLADMNLWGTVLSLSESSGQIELQVGQARLTLSSEDVKKVKRSPGKGPPEFAVVREGLSRRATLPRRALELDLRGKRADEVAPELDRYLNDASLARLGQVRIVHGIATGTVRQIVRTMLASHPLVKSFRPGERGEGGDGATIVEL